MTEIFVGRALARAKEVDDILRDTGEPIGPLHGLPISLKDQFAMEGLETIMGMPLTVSKQMHKKMVPHRLRCVDWQSLNDRQRPRRHFVWPWGSAFRANKCSTNTDGELHSFIRRASFMISVVGRNVQPRIRANHKPFQPSLHPRWIVRR